MIDGHDHKAGPRKVGGEPAHHARRPAKAVAEQDYRPAPVVEPGRIQRRRADPEQRAIRRAKVKRPFLDAIPCGIPDGDVQLSAVLGVAQGGRRLMGHKVTFAHGVGPGPARGRRHGQGGRNQAKDTDHQKLPHSPTRIAPN